MLRALFDVAHCRSGAKRAKTLRKNGKRRRQQAIRGKAERFVCNAGSQAGREVGREEGSGKRGNATRCAALRLVLLLLLAVVAVADVRR